ncbi:hypothetical protein EMCRGX_G031000 [Ephydatia muelleri]|eukprot:Em0018g1015a
MADLQLFKQVIEKVDWTEPWLLALMGFHTAVFVLIILSRRHQFVQATLLALLGILCVAGESVNQWAAINYRKFAAHQYFDAGGFFISLVYSAPMIFNCLAIVVSWLYVTWQLLADLARAKAKQRYKEYRSLTDNKKQK